MAPVKGGGISGLLYLWLLRDPVCTHARMPSDRRPIGSVSSAFGPANLALVAVPSPLYPSLGALPPSHRSCRFSRSQAEVLLVP